MSQCDNTQPHIAHHADDWAWECPGIKQDAVPEGGFERVLDWLMTDYECNGIEIQVGSQGPDYNDLDEMVDRQLWYEVKLIETAVYGSREVADNAMTEPRFSHVEHHGHGDTLDQAAADALAMRDEHWEEMAQHGPS